MAGDVERRGDDAAQLDEDAAFVLPALAAQRVETVDKGFAAKAAGGFVVEGHEGLLHAGNPGVGGDHRDIGFLQLLDDAAHGLAAPGGQQHAVDAAVELRLQRLQLFAGVIGAEDVEGDGIAVLGLDALRLLLLAERHSVEIDVVRVPPDDGDLVVLGRDRSCGQPQRGESRASHK
nr:hypothetical protein [Hoeflea olei]